MTAFWAEPDFDDHEMVQVVRGRRDGPRLFVCAAVHGDELNGIEIIRRLLQWPALRAHGFRVLFEAAWIVHAGPSPTVSPAEHGWEQVHDEAGLVGWERAWRGDDGPTGLFTPELLDDATIVII